MTTATGRYLWGKTGEGRDVYEAALDRVRHAYDNFDDVLVLFSGGKDSTATLHVALDVAAERGAGPVRVVHYDEECITYETEDYVRRVAQRDDVDLEWYCLPVRHRNACSPDAPIWWPWAPEAEALWARPMPPEGVTELAGFVVDPPDARLSIPDCQPLLVRNGRTTAALMGIRADESMTRRMAVANGRRENYVIPTSHPAFAKVYPVYDWKTADVWTAPARFGWDYNRTYDVMEMLGIGHSAQRCAPPFGEEPMGLLHMWASCFPELWDRMCDRVPGAAAAARYAKTELYSYGVVVEKPPGVTWAEHVRRRVEAHDPELRQFVAYNVRNEIRRHYSHTAEPIMPTARHPDTGVSWERLFMLADRADVKNRRSQGGRVMAKDHAKVRAEYDAERAAVEAGEVEL